MLFYFSTLASSDTELLLTFQQNLKKAHKIKQKTDSYSRKT